MMKLFIWFYLDGVTDNYHDGGGLVVVAKDLEEAKALNGVIGDNAPDKVYDLKGKNKEEFFIFPDSGCC